MTQDAETPRYYIAPQTCPRLGGEVFFVFDRERKDPETGDDAWVAYASTHAEALARVEKLEERDWHINMRRQFGPHGPGPVL